MRCSVVAVVYRKFSPVERQNQHGRHFHSVIFSFCAFLVVLVVVQQSSISSFFDLGFFILSENKFDLYSIIFLLSLSLITLVVISFGETYVGGDINKPSFWFVLTGFVFGMSLLIQGGDFLTLVVG